LPFAFHVASSDVGILGLHWAGQGPEVAGCCALEDSELPIGVGVARIRKIALVKGRKKRSFQGKAIWIRAA